jgi:hypothetical protein
MFNGFRFQFDLLSLILGVVLATIFWWLVQLVRPQLNQIRSSFKQNKSKVKEKGPSGIEERYRKLILKQVQGMHLAASLFSLDEIAVAPKLIAPPARMEPGMTHGEVDVVSQTLPYMPAFPELAATYGASSFSLAKALAGNVNIVLIGQPGAGKTFTLAHFAALLINHSPQTDHLKSYIPIMVHVSDLDNSAKAPDLVSSITEVVSEQASVFDANRMPRFIRSLFDDGRAMLLIDGVDELAPDAMVQFSENIKPLLRNYPRVKIVTTASAEYIDGLASLGFSPLVVLPWGPDQQNEFLGKWANLWIKYISNEAWAQSTISGIDTLLLNQWLKSDVYNLTPLEFTLKTWGTYAGDIRGSQPLDFVETHVRRMMPAGIPLEALGVLGHQVITNSSIIFESRLAKNWIRSFEPDDAETDAAADDSVIQGAESNNSEAGAESINETSNKKNKKKHSGKTSAPKASLLSKLTDSGLLENRRNGKMRFAHVVFSGILTGEVMNAASASLIRGQEPWCGRSLALNSFAAKNDATDLVNSLLSTTDEMLERNILATGRFLRDAPKQAVWRSKVLSSLVQLIKSDKPIALRMQAIAAIVLSEDPSGYILFRQLMQLSDNGIRQMAVLACGAVRDIKAVDQVIALVGDYSAQVRRAACLALVAIGTPQCLEAVARALLRGEEDLRRAAAEALANNHVEGYATLQEGSSSKDILLRRAVVYGLARLDDQWAQEILERLQVEDEQWVVRNAAVEVLESRTKISPRVPRKMSAPHEAPWLIEFAGRYGVGIAPGAPTTDLLLRALKSDKEDERLAALNYLRVMPSESVMSGLFQTYYSTEDANMKESIYFVLWEYALAGYKIPSPMQYGLG